MPKTLEGICDNGIIKTLTKPPKNISQQKVVITFVDFGKNNKSKGNAQKIMDILENYKGILTNKFSKESSASYVARLRKQTQKDWQERLTRIGIK